MTSLFLTRDRDAYPVIRGFRYQIDQTILRWLDLCDDQALELERGEDIDLVNGTLLSGEEHSRVLEQIKHLVGAITLKSAPCIEALANALEHREANPHHQLLFRFCTNAQSTIERPSPFKPRRPGIMVWEALRTGIERADVGAPERIRTILRGAKQPEKCRSDSWARFTRFVKSATSQELLDLIVTFEWGIGSDGSEDLELKITAR